MARKSPKDDNEDKDHMDGPETFLEIGEKLFRCSDMLEEIAPKADLLTPEDMVILLSMSLALEAHLKGIRYRYAVIGHE